MIATLSATCRPTSRASSAGPSKLLPSGSRPRCLSHLCSAEARRWPEVEHAEAARVDEAEDGAVVEVEGQVLVGSGGRAVEHQPARHAEMQQQRLAVVEHQLYDTWLAWRSR